MSETLKHRISAICQDYGDDSSRMMDIVITLQKQVGCICSDAMDMIAEKLKVKRVEVESTVSFYSFLSSEQKGKYVIRLCQDIVDKIKGFEDVSAVFSKELGLLPGQTSSDKNVSLEYTPCIGMCDQAPAALINDVVFTNLTPQKADEIVKALKESTDLKDLIKAYGDGNNADDLIQSMVNNNIKKKDNVIFSQREEDAGLKKAISLSPAEIIREIKLSKLRGRGGAGFPTGMKWELTRNSKEEKKFIICNADEGEPGTFKDRVLLTEQFEMVCEGMTIGGYALGAEEGIIYLRGEYLYLRRFLEGKLKERREKKLLGRNILGKDNFHFDIKIQIGAGAYICGEESALISSCEGLRGDPKTRPPFPVQKGYKNDPTAVNNVETYCCVSRILEMGSNWFASIGTNESKGTKLLSISGDCANPGVYEYPFGIKINTILKDVGALNPAAILVGGPSGTMISKESFDKTICYEDLSTGGAIIVFNEERNILEIVHSYMEFFTEESCGFCTPCRVGNTLLLNCVKNIMNGKGEINDLSYLLELGETISFSSRCGLGKTSPNIVLSTLKNFRSEYESVVNKEAGGRISSFDIKAALADAEKIMDRKSEIFKEN